MKLKSILGAILMACSLLMAWVGWDNWGRFQVPDDAWRSPEADSPTAPEAWQKKGAYLAAIGGCVGCHTDKGRPLLSGGRRIETPYGPVFSSNLTSSPQHGLGAWTFREFESAMRWGRSRDGRLLLPVFPYNHTSLLARDDVYAIFMWLQSVPALEQAVPAHRLTWPLGTQPVIAVWRSLFFEPQNWQPSPDKSDAWNRGAYLVQGLGHCATCHGQRKPLDGFPVVSDLSGAMLSAQAWWAPSLIDPSQTAIAQMDVNDLAWLLRAGANQHASLSGPMGEFAQQASQYLSVEDAKSMAVYLKSQTSPATAVAARKAPASAQVAQLYQTQCASCHGDQGQGESSKYPALAGNPAMNQAHAENAIQKVLYGGYGHSTALRPRPYGMPPFLFTLSNQEIADVLTYVRQSWGNHGTVITPMQVDAVRAAKY